MLVNFFPRKNNPFIWIDKNNTGSCSYSTSSIFSWFIPDTNYKYHPILLHCCNTHRQYLTLIGSNINSKEILDNLNHRIDFYSLKKIIISQLNRNLPTNPKECARLVLLKKHYTHQEFFLLLVDYNQENIILNLQTKYASEIKQIKKTLFLISEKAYKERISENDFNDYDIQYIKKNNPIFNKGEILFNTDIHNLPFKEKLSLLEKANNDYFIRDEIFVLLDKIKRFPETFPQETNKVQYHPITMEFCETTKEFLTLMDTDIPHSRIKKHFLKAHDFIWRNLLLKAELLETTLSTLAYNESAEHRYSTFVEQVQLAAVTWYYPFIDVNDKDPCVYALTAKYLQQINPSLIQMISKEAYNSNIPEDYDEFYLKLFIEKLKLIYKNKKYLFLDKLNK